MKRERYLTARRRRRKRIALRVLQVTLMLATLSGAGTFVWKYVSGDFVNNTGIIEDNQGNNAGYYNNESSNGSGDSTEEYAWTVDSNVYKTHTYESGDLRNKLRELSLSSEEYRKIYDNMSMYPEELIEALCYNEELLDYAKGYLNASGKVQGGLTKNELKEDFPLLLQWDSRWGYVKYGDSMIGLSGCGPTCLSMAAVALTGDGGVTPDVVAEYAWKNGYYQKNAGTAWSLMTEGCRNFGIQGEEICLDENVIINYLNNGLPIICSMAPGDFTKKGHFIMLVGTKDSKIVVNDPNSRQRSNELWDYSVLKSQIKNLWVFHKI